MFFYKYKLVNSFNGAFLLSYFPLTLELIPHTWKCRKHCEKRKQAFIKIPKYTDNIIKSRHFTVPV